MKVERCDSCGREGAGARYRFSYGLKPPGHSPTTGRPVLRLLGEIDEFVCRTCERRLIRTTVVRGVIATGAAASIGVYLYGENLDQFKIPLSLLVVLAGTISAGVAAFVELVVRSHVSAVEAALLRQRENPDGRELVVYPPDWVARTQRESKGE